MKPRSRNFTSKETAVIDAIDKRRRPKRKVQMEIARYIDRDSCFVTVFEAARFSGFMDRGKFVEVESV